MRCRTVGSMNEILGVLQLEKHPKKTFVGTIERGFDFHDYHFAANSLTLAVGTRPNLAEPMSVRPLQSATDLT
jgi:hypothetical protein